MFEQYLRIKEGYPDALLFYRMGDFYELFFEDAEVASRELQIALTSRNPNAEAPIPMCGVPWHAAEGYVSQLLNKGYKIAFCDQVEDPRAAKGLVERAVTRVYTPGTAVEDVSLEPKGHTYLGALFWVRHGSRRVRVGGRLHRLLGRAARQRVRNSGSGRRRSPRANSCCRKTPTSRPRCTLRTFRPSASRCGAISTTSVPPSASLPPSPSPNWEPFGAARLVQACGHCRLRTEQTQMQDAKHLAPFEPLDLGPHLPHRRRWAQSGTVPPPRQGVKAWVRCAM
ncbi:MAG: hypothetical protein ACLSHC_15665 [Bilophila wadsworthia]